MDHKGIPYNSDAKAKVDLIALHFPRPKVLAFATTLGVPTVKTLEIWKLNRIAKLLELYEENSMMLPLNKYLDDVLLTRPYLVKYNKLMEEHLELMKKDK